MAVDSPDDDLILGKLAEPSDDETAAVAGRIVAVIGFVDVDKTLVLWAAKKMQVIVTKKSKN